MLKTYRKQQNRSAEACLLDGRNDENDEPDLLAGAADERRVT